MRPVARDGKAESLDAHERETLQKFIDRVVVNAVPRGRGRWDPIENRVEVYFVDAEKPYRPRYDKFTKTELAKLPA